ncbi:MAG: NTP transferase domain-containing protein, partial [Acidobacteriota bacterium]
MISPNPPDSSAPETEIPEFPIAVLLAAGEGRRLRAIGSRCPKPLVALLGLSLAERCIANFMAAGVDRFLVVLGYREETVKAHFEKIGERRGCDIRFALAEDWKQGNGTSASAA